MTTYLTSDELFSQLDEFGIPYTVTRHRPLMTVEDAKAIRTYSDSDQGQVKNLFVKNKKNKMWLLTVHEDRQINLKETAMALGARRFSFCSPERLMEYLGVIPGAVSPLALLNDINQEVAFYIDARLLKDPVLHVHPLDNRITVSIGTQDLLEFLSHHGHPHETLAF